MLLFSYKKKPNLKRIRKEIRKNEKEFLALKSLPFKKARLVLCANNRFTGL